MGTIRFKSTSVWFIFFTLLLLSSCVMRSTPPGPNTAGGSVEGVSYSYHQWAQGLSIMIWHDLNGGGSCGGSGSTSDPVYRVDCIAEGIDGSMLEWQIHSTDGVTADMRINDQEYNLADGTLFLIDHREGTAHVVQLKRDFSNLVATPESITAFAPTDQDVANFIESVKESRLSD
jgi:hypothetical protein